MTFQRLQMPAIKFLIKPAGIGVRDSPKSSIEVGRNNEVAPTMRRTAEAAYRQGGLEGHPAALDRFAAGRICS